MSKILNLSQVKENDVLKVIPKGKPSSYCVVKYCEPVEVSFLEERGIKSKEGSSYYMLAMIEFSKNPRPWSTILPNITTDSFVSLGDDGYDFTFHTSTIEEVRNFLEEEKKLEIESILNKAQKSVEEVFKSYEEIVRSTFEKLLFDEKEIV